MRNISNVAFIVAFLVIIYSQLTSVGISNYGVKKMLPRLVIAAVLVNLSFTFCAVLLDLSNVTGYAFQDAFMGIKKHNIHRRRKYGRRLDMVGSYCDDYYPTSV